MELLQADGEQKLLRILEDRSGQNVFACYQCGKCTAACPFALLPQQVMRHLQLGLLDRALALPSTWECAGCMTCASVCPQGVNAPRLMRAMRGLRHGLEDGTPLAEGEAEHVDRLTRLASRQYRAHTHALRTHLLANFHRTARWGSALAPASNWILGLPGARLLAHHFLGIHKSRGLPVFARPSFPTYFRRHVPAGDGRRGRVILFHDTFMDYEVPQVGIAATEILERAGFRVELSDTVCCGRAMISKGLMDKAAGHALTNVERLYEPARHGIFIVGCEPSCLLALREEYADLLSGKAAQEKARVVARQSLLIDEFLCQLATHGDLDLPLAPAPASDRPVVFHAHCQQRASADPTRSLELLARAGYQPELTDALCCGMAGAFGYEREHYERSRAAAERVLLPALRERPGAEMAVMGTSCRQQILHFTGRPVRHVVELLRDALASPGAAPGEGSPRPARCSPASPMIPACGAWRAPHGPEPASGITRPAGEIDPEGETP